MIILMDDFDDYWADCPESGCTNKVCRALNSDRCFIHTPGNEHIKRWKIEARNVTPDLPTRLPPARPLRRDAG